MKTYASLAICSVALLAACGGGGGSASNTPASLSLTTQRVFADRAGVARGTDDSGNKVILITPEVAAVVSAPDNSTADIQVSAFPVVRNLNTNARLRQGAITVDGVAVNVTVVEDNGGEAALALAEIPGFANQLMAISTPSTTLPSGNFQYSGTLATGVRNVNNPQVELGSFTLDANFNAQSFAINGSTTSDTVSGSGVIDNSSGKINSSNITMVTSGTNRTATLYGQFSGNNAESVSGVFHTNEQTPAYAGGFVGSR